MRSNDVCNLHRWTPSSHSDDDWPCNIESKHYKGGHWRYRTSAGILSAFLLVTMFSASVLTAFVLIGVAVANPLNSRSSAFQIHELRETLPQGFTAVGPAPPQQTLNLRLALAQSNPDGIVNALYEVSDPDSASYGQYLSKEEVRSTICSNRVRNWR